MTKTELEERECTHYIKYFSPSFTSAKAEDNYLELTVEHLFTDYFLYLLQTLKKTCDLQLKSKTAKYRIVQLFS